MSDETCMNCGEDRILIQTPGGGMACAACGHGHHDCGRCGGTVKERDWKSPASMCPRCWHATIAGEAHPCQAVAG